MNPRVRSFLFGMAPVPDTHMVHQLSGETIVSKANRIAGNALARVRAPEFAPVSLTLAA